MKMDQMVKVFKFTRKDGTPTMSKGCKLSVLLREFAIEGYRAVKATQENGRRVIEFRKYRSRVYYKVYC